MRTLMTFILALACFSFTACSNVLFHSGGSKSNKVNTAAGTVVPGVGDVIDGNSDLNLPPDTADMVACMNENGDSGVYVCRIPLDHTG